ncbi:conserved membrane hypothetical protein [Tenacibaculum sp. 190524A02b]|uniref:DUF3810 domain-containing protein n=2 Tax=Tenacibaculum vairaonense TaxID=3137860 RepID=A0ABP1FHX0_9FLAO
MAMKYSKTTLILTFLLPIQVMIVQYLSQKPIFIERYYSNGIYPYIAKILRILLGWIPFSFGDLLGLLLIFIFCKNIYKLFISKFTNFIPKLLQFTAFLSVLYFCFYAFWGLNYFREPLAKSLALEQSNYTTEQLETTLIKIIPKLNNSHFTITQNDTIAVTVPYSRKQMYHLAPNGFNVLAKTYPQLSYTAPSIKSSLVSLLQSYNGTSGYLNPITGEAQVNDLMPKPGYPSTTCHEMAHQIGWSAENDANFVGFLACIYNNDKYFQYAGYRMAFRYLIQELTRRDKELAKTINKGVNKGIFKDYRNSYLHWKKYENPIEPYLKKGYNSYLKANNQANGIKSYSYVVDLLIAYFEKHHN